VSETRSSWYRTFANAGEECDPDRFNLQPEEAKRRRALFCDLLLYDMGLVCAFLCATEIRLLSNHHKALMFSRPVAISSGYYDVRVPTDEAAGRTPESDCALSTCSSLA
jgi:hypothetical protein